MPIERTGRFLGYPTGLPPAELVDAHEAITPQWLPRTVWSARHSNRVLYASCWRCCTAAGGEQVVMPYGP